MEYLEFLRGQKEFLQKKLGVLLKKYKVQPAGNGYIDLIISTEALEEFINGLTLMNIAVMGFTWWCHCTEQSQKELGCPHGMGGPLSKYYDGWFSETTMCKLSPKEDLVVR